MAYEFDNFLLALAAHITAKAAALTPPVTIALGSGIFVGNAWEDGAAEVYSVLRRYDGQIPTQVPVPWCAVQISTRARSDAAACERAAVIQQTLLADDGRPLRMAVLEPAPGTDGVERTFRINGFELQAPFALAPLSNGLHEVVFNLRQLRFVRLA